MSLKIDDNNFNDYYKFDDDNKISDGTLPVYNIMIVVQFSVCRKKGKVFFLNTLDEVGSKGVLSEFLFSWINSKCN